MRLLPQPRGFEGGIVVEKELLANDSAGGERHDDGPLVVNCGSAAEPAPDDAPSHEGAIVAEIHEFSWRELEVAPLSDPALLEAHALVPTAVHAVVAKLYESRVGDQLDLRVIAGDGRLEVAAVMRLESQPSRATECRRSRERGGKRQTSRSTSARTPGKRKPRRSSRRRREWGATVSGWRKISVFSRDIAYSRSPTASRAAARSR